MKIVRTFTLAGAAKTPASRFGILPSQAEGEAPVTPDPLRTLILHAETNAKEKFLNGTPSGELHIVVAPEDGALDPADLVIDGEWTVTIERKK
jgi:hypothetical protein